MFGNIPLTEAKFLFNNECENIWENFLLKSLLHIIYGILAILTLMILRKIYKSVILYKWHISVKNDRHCSIGNSHIFLEIFNDKMKLLTYLGTVRLSSVNFRISSDTFLENVEISNNWFFNTALFQWSNQHFVLPSPISRLEASDTANHALFRLPNQLSLGPRDSSKLRKILVSHYNSRLVLLEDIYYAISDVSASETEPEIHL